MSDEETRLDAMSYLRQGASARELVAKLDVPYPQLLRWKKELKQAEENGTVASLIDVDALVLEKVANETKEALRNFAPTAEEEIEAKVGEVVSKVDGLQALNLQTQETASTMLTKIKGMALLATDIQEIESLTNSLTKIQTAFFNKPGGINVLNAPGASGEGLLGLFKQNQVD